MKKLLIILLTFLSTCVTAQDGSDIKYIDIENLDSSIVGKFIHIDFFNNSFGSNKFHHVNNDTIIIDFEFHHVKADTITIDFVRKQKFKEIRNDDNLNNWFSEQYLETINEENGQRLRIQKMKLLDISEESITVKLFGHYFKDDQEVFSEYLTQTALFKKKDIYQILVDGNPPIRKGLSIYRVYYLYPDFTENTKTGCNYCFTPSENNLFDNSLLSDYHIERFDFENQQIVLTELGKKIVENFKIPLRGLPVVMTLDGEIIYGFWFWNRDSSFGCDRVYTYPNIDFKIKFGLPLNNKFGKDPRFDERLKKYSKLKNK